MSDRSDIQTVLSERRTATVALAVSALAVVLAGVFVAARVSAVGFDGFVGAGAVTADGASVFTYDHYGYDGQFFYRLALEPFSTAERVDGIAFDAPAYRQQRIGYPLMAYAVSVTPLSTVQSLVVVNLAAIGAMVYFAARIAQRAGRSPLFGLLTLAWPAFVFSMGLDLSEIVAAALVLGGVGFALQARHGLAAGLLAGAALTRETTLLVAIVALFTYRRWVYAWVVGVLAAWEGVVIAMWGEIPGITSRPTPGGALLGFPFLGWAEAVGRWGVLDLASVAALVVVIWIGVRHFRPHTLPGSAFVAYLVLAACLGAQVAESWRGFTRATVELALMVFVLRVTHGLVRESVLAPSEPPPPASAPA